MTIKTAQQKRNAKGLQVGTMQSATTVLLDGSSTVTTIQPTYPSAKSGDRVCIQRIRGRRYVALPLFEPSGLGSGDITGTDLNTVTVPGTYTASAGTTALHAPVATGQYIVSVESTPGASSSLWVRQTFSIASTGQTWQRVYNNGTWSAWDAGIASKIRVAKIAGGAIAASSFIIWPDVISDTLGQYNSSTGLFTAKVAGTYLSSIQFKTAASPAAPPNAFVYENGTVKEITGNPTLNSYMANAMTTHHDLAVGGTLQLWSQGGWTMQNDSPSYGNFWQITRVGN